MPSLLLVSIAQVAFLLQVLPHSTATSPRLPNGTGQVTVIGCPDPGDIDPCVCSVDDTTAEINMDCSEVVGNEELKRVFEADFVFPDLHRLEIIGKSDPIDITKLEADTFGKVSFSHVVISKTNLREIDTLAFANSFPTIETMELTNNDIELFPFEILADCEKLVELRLPNNALEHMSILHSATLKVLDVSNNPGLRYEDSSFQTAPELQSITLSNINLGHISPLTFAYQTQLKLLDLSNNDIDYLYDYALKFLSSTPVDVNLSNNRIATVEQMAISDWQKGSKLRINSNMLLDLPQNIWEGVFIALEGNGTIEMDDNLIDCACNIKWLVLSSTHLETLKDGNECNDKTSIHDPDLINFITNHC